MKRLVAEEVAKKSRRKCQISRRARIAEEEAAKKLAEEAENTKVIPDLPPDNN